MKKLLLLGGTYSNIYFIHTAKKLGHYVITCDNKPSNPAHKYSDEYYEVSVLNKEEVLRLAKKLKIDGIVGTAPDQAANTVAYVAENMGLPGQPIKSVEILTNKDLFRKFLLDNGFNCPKAKGYSISNIDEAVRDWVNVKNNIIVKPVDAESSRGVSEVENKECLEEKIKYALSFSRNNRFIIEEYIDLPQLDGDVFSINGKLKFVCMGYQYFYKYSVLGEAFYTDIQKDKIQKDVQKIINLLSFTNSVYNLEVRYNDDDIYIMEISPRNGGNVVTQTIEYCTGINLAEYTINAALNIDILNLVNPENRKYSSYYNIHSTKKGILKKIEILDELKNNNILELNILKNIGDEVEDFYNGAQYIGNIIMKFSSKDEMLEKMDNMNKYIKVIVE